jgi:hypothetical protein
MQAWLESMLEAWDAQATPSLRFRAYWVAPRQGRYGVQRKLMRQLEVRLGRHSDE